MTAPQHSPSTPRCAHLTNPLGLDETRLRLSWQYGVTAQVREGDHARGAIPGDGWFAGK